MAPPELVVVFRTHSEIEARIVRGLLEAHDIPMVVGMPASAFPMAVNAFGEITISVHPADADGSGARRARGVTMGQDGQERRDRQEMQDRQDPPVGGARVGETW